MAVAGMKLTGDKQLLKLLRSLPRDKQVRGAVRKAVNAGAQVIVKAARAKARQFNRSGALAKSINKVVRTGKDKQSLYAVIGPQRGSKGEHDGKIVLPTKYAHLVERGHINRDGSFTQGKHFMRSAAAESESAAAGAFNTKLGPAIEAEAAKAAKKGRRK